MFSPVVTFHVSGSFCPSAIPAARVPRNDGQLPCAGAAAGNAGIFGAAVLVMLRVGTASASSTGRHVLRSRIIRRGVHESFSIENVTCVPERLMVYVAGSAHPVGGFESQRSTRDPLAFHVPESVGQPCPAIVNVPSALNCPVNAPNASLPAGRLAVCCAAPSATHPSAPAMITG